MDRAKDFLHEISEDILKFMDSHRGKWSHDKVVYLAAMCDAHNNVCEFVEFAEKHGGKSSLFGETTGMFADNLPRRTR